MTVAREYFQRVLSPWAPGVDNPIPAFVDSFAGPRRLAVDVGCGPGVLTCYLGQTFDRVVAIDRDPEMVEATGELFNSLRDRGVPLGDVDVRCEDWRDSDVTGADLVCAVNSILEPQDEKRRALVEGLALALSSTNVAATLVAVFPAMEAQVHLLNLYEARLRETGLSEEEVQSRLQDEFIEAHQFDAEAGTFASVGEAAQKFYYEQELADTLADAGLTTERLERLTYSWEVCAAVDGGYFPGQLELWDWFVLARRAAVPQDNGEQNKARLH